MTINNIIEELERTGVVREWANNIARKMGGIKKENMDDLIQDIYLSLLQKNEELIIDLYNKKELKYFILIMLRNNILSKNSPFYSHYIKWEQRRSDIDAILLQDDNTDEEEEN